eukprot:CAMPEP_0174894860 /NCGR_PEP_ID=MMETSP0167-20121228/9395_1 /TAXON_ID=38298 /ORGANISM="Rhodella maculata, Strain CCMP736" /LENGTH=145 /DNA_ID=CAMNT_0016134053 /DNA_START=720 /DNA_END=1159 /DNA_ORIENTATION=-
MTSLFDIFRAYFDSLDPKQIGRSPPLGIPSAHLFGDNFVSDEMGGVDPPAWLPIRGVRDLWISSIALTPSAPTFSLSYMSENEADIILPTRIPTGLGSASSSPAPPISEFCMLIAVSPPAPGRAPAARPPTGVRQPSLLPHIDAF